MAARHIGGLRLPMGGLGSAPVTAPVTASAHRTLRFRALLALLLLLAALPLAASLPEGTPRDGWVRYTVPIVAGQEGPCCHEFAGGVSVRRGCSLEGGDVNHSRATQVLVQDAGVATDAGELAVYLRLRDGKVDEVHAFGATCPVHAETRPLGIAMSSTDSIALLGDLARQPRGPADQAVVALAFHAGAQATTALEALTAATAPREAREQAVFWLSQARGAGGARIVERIARGQGDAAGDAALREHAVFALSQTDAIDSFPVLSEIARSDRSADVRARALFWMAQMDDARAADAILAALRDDPSSDVREQAVFALSQLDDADAALIRVVRGDYPREARKRALFWLGQSGSEEALRLLDDVLAM